MQLAKKYKTILMHLMTKLEKVILQLSTKVEIKIQVLLNYLGFDNIILKYQILLYSHFHLILD